MIGRRLPACTALLGLLSLAPLMAAPVITSCTDFGCRNQQRVTLDDPSWQRVARLFDGVDSAAAERSAIAQAIALLEADVGLRTGTWRDKAYNWQRAGEPGELDCIAESNNTDRYLKTLEQAGLLHWHHTLAREMRGLFFVHWTAVIEDKANGSRWAVDSWFRDNGQPPVIIPLAQWYHYSGPDN